MSSSSSKKKLKFSIVLNEKEKQICTLLKNVVDARGLNTTMRIAGGWVRDKLLGLDSDDIDIALEKMTGKDFAEHVNDYLKERGQKTRTIGVIKMNPGQSKHLETATVPLFDISIDFVNLRSETYDSDSRIPSEIKFGTPSEDAERRDITINSLFYNINEDKIEDFTGKGINDLEEGIIRTPLPPVETFTDDPLRCLRVIRFAGRFNFDIDPVTYAALSDDVSKKGIKSKVSRERVGKEIEKMFKDSQGSIALYHLHQTGLFDLVFQPNEPDQLIQNASLEASQVSRCADWLLSSSESKHLDKAKFKFDPEERRVMYLSAALISYRASTMLDKKNKLIPLASFIVLESIKFPNKEARATSSVLESLEEFEHLAADPARLSRRECGIAVRKPAELWRVVIILGLAREISPFLVSIHPKKPVSFSKDIEPSVARWMALVKKIEDYKLEGCWNEKPLLNGKDLSALLGLPLGPAIGVVLQSLADWQLENPTKTVEEAKTWLLSEKQAGRFDQGFS